MGNKNTVYGIVIVLLLVIIALLFIGFNNSRVTGNVVSVDSALEEESTFVPDSVLPEYHDTFLVYKGPLFNGMAMLVYEREVEDVEEDNLIIKLKKRENRDYRELAEYLSINRIPGVIIHTEDMEIGEEISEEIGASVIVKFGKVASDGSIIRK